MRNKLIVASCGLALSALAAGCNAGTDTTNANIQNANMTVAAVNANTDMAAQQQVRPAPDNSEIMIDTDGVVRTEIRTFRDPNSRVERVVVTTREGKRTARVYYRDRTVRELPDNEVERALEATGDTLAAAGGKVVDVSKEVGSEAADKTRDALGAAGDKAEDVGGAAAKGAKAAASGARAVGSEVGDKAEDVGGAAASGAKKAGSATVSGAKKVGEGAKTGAKKVGEGAKKLGDAITP